jgi:hypothetical protein
MQIKPAREQAMLSSEAGWLPGGAFPTTWDG